MILRLIGLRKMKKVIKYDKRIYSPDAIKRAIDAFSPVHQITVRSENGAEYQLEFEITESSPRLSGEFNNYLIQLENRTCCEK